MKQARTLPLEALTRHLSQQAKVERGTDVRTSYARDCWPDRNLRARSGAPPEFPPDAVITPACVEDVQHIARWAREHATPVVPFGAGSGVAGGTLALRGGVMIDAKLLDGLDTTRASDGMATAGAGWVGARLEHELGRRGLTLGHFPSSLGCSTLGGYLATRSAGQLSTRHGKIEDLVVSARMVLPDGSLADSFGFEQDPLPLWIGSEGTLGFFVDATLRIERRPSARRARGFAVPSIQEGLEAMRRVLQAGHRPAVLRLYDEFDTFISGARKAGAAPALVARLADTDPRSVRLPTREGGARGAKERAMRAANALLARSVGAPLVLNRLADRVYDACLLIVGVEEEDDALADAVAADVFDEVRADEHGAVRDLGEGPGAHWYANRMAVSYKMSPMIDAGFFVDTMEVATTWSNLPNLYHEVKRSLGRKAFVMAHFSHGYVPGGSIYFTFAGFARDDDHAGEAYAEAWQTAMDAVERAGGAVTHHHGIGVLKAGRLDGDHEGGRALFETVKSATDPDDLWNPGKLWRVRGRFA